MTLDDYKSFIAVDDMSEFADNLLQLGRTLCEAENFAEYYLSLIHSSNIRLILIHSIRTQFPKLVYIEQIDVYKRQLLQFQYSKSSSHCIRYLCDGYCHVLQDRKSVV